MLEFSAPPAEDAFAAHKAQSKLQIENCVATVPDWTPDQVALECVLCACSSCVHVYPTSLKHSNQTKT